MNLKITIRVATLLFVLGYFLFFFAGSSDDSIWFAVGGGLGLINLILAGLLVKFGLKSTLHKGLFLGLLLLKSLVFVMTIALVLVFLKPKLLPFTLGVGIVIFGAIGAAAFESRHLLRKHNRTT